MTLNQSLRNIGNVVNLSTPLGIAVAVLSGARLRRINGLVVADGARLPFIPASALTVGSVVIVPRKSLEDVTSRIPGLLEHEDHHAHQWAYCLGLPFIPLYFASTGWSWLRTGDRSTCNHFEVQAGLDLGGYACGTKRPVRDGVRALTEAAGRAVSQRRRRSAERAA